jgi:hypothetical protein
VVCGAGRQQLAGPLALVRQGGLPRPGHVELPGLAASKVQVQGDFAGTQWAEVKNGMGVLNTTAAAEAWFKGQKPRRPVYVYVCIFA